MGKGKKQLRKKINEKLNVVRKRMKKWGPIKKLKSTSLEQYMNNLYLTYIALNEEKLVSDVRDRIKIIEKRGKGGNKYSIHKNVHEMFCVQNGKDTYYYVVVVQAGIGIVQFILLLDHIPKVAAKKYTKEQGYADGYKNYYRIEKVIDIAHYNIELPGTETVAYIHEKRCNDAFTKIKDLIFEGGIL